MAAGGRVVVDIGCGRKKRQGAIGVDSVKLPGVDVVVDLEKARLPFRTGSVDEVYATHVLEHIGNLVPLVEEIHRVLAKGGRLFIRVPHFTDAGAFRDITHKRFFAWDSFLAFCPPAGAIDYYSKARFRVAGRRLEFAKNGVLFYNILLEPLFNAVPLVWETSFLRVFPARELAVVLEKA